MSFYLHSRNEPDHYCFNFSNFRYSAANAGYYRCDKYVRIQIFLTSLFPYQDRISYILKQTCGFQLQVCLSMYEILSWYGKRLVKKKTYSDIFDVVMVDAIDIDRCIDRKWVYMSLQWWIKNTKKSWVLQGCRNVILLASIPKCLEEQILW